MASFLTGFADAFNQARARTEQNDADQENMLFKYKMDNLMDQKKKRDAKKLEESENQKKAKDLAAQMGDNDSASIFYNELANGVSYENLQKRVVNGEYQKNDNYKAPDQTIKMPQPVTHQYDTEVNPMAPAQTNQSGLGGIFAAGKQKSYDRMMGNVNKKIDAIDPTLRSETTTETNTTTTTDPNNSKYVYKPKSVLQVGNLDDAIYQKNLADKSGNVKASQEAQAKIEAIQKAEIMKAKANAIAQGKNTSSYIMQNEDGTMSQFVGETRDNTDGTQTLYNISNPNKPMPVTGSPIAISDEQHKRLWKLQDDYGKPAQEYKTKASAFAEGLHTVAKIDNLLKNDPSVATQSRNIQQSINNLSAEAKASWEILQQLQSDIQSEAGKPDGGNSTELMTKYSKTLEDFSQQVGNSNGMQKMAANRALFESLKVQAAFQFASANGQSGRSMSDKDYQNFLQQLGVGNSNVTDITPGLRSTINNTFFGLESDRKNLDNNAAVYQFERELGLKKGSLGLNGDGMRIGDMISRMDWPDEDKAQMLDYLKSASDVYRQSSQATQNAINNQQQGTQDNPVRINSVEEFNKLPKGTVYTDPNGKTRTKK